MDGEGGMFRRPTLFNLSHFKFRRFYRGGGRFAVQPTQHPTSCFVCHTTGLNYPRRIFAQFRNPTVNISNFIFQILLNVQVGANISRSNFGHKLLERIIGIAESASLGKTFAVKPFAMTTGMNTFVKQCFIIHSSPSN